VRHDEHFTIVVDAIDPNKPIEFGDLRLRHQDCSKGPIEQTEDYHGRWWILKCRRCSRSVQLDPSATTTGAIVLTASDGVERHLGDAYRQCTVVRDEGEPSGRADDQVESHLVVFRVALTSGATVDILAARYAREGGMRLWEFYDADDVLIASFDEHAVAAIVRVDSIVGGSPPRLSRADDDDADLKESEEDE
jgi:hypothetical protein